MDDLTDFDLTPREAVAAAIALALTNAVVWTAVFGALT